MRLYFVPLGVLLAACGPDVSITKRSFDEDSDGYSSEVDCDDAHATVNPDAAEVCDDLDNDCNGLVDDEPSDSETFHADVDGDGAGDPDATRIACEAPEGFVANASDCDDAEPAASPGNTEVCDGIDNDCDGTVDDDATDATSWYADNDADGYGDAALSVADCAAPEGYVADAMDCDDADAAVHPDATEYDCADPTDYNCDGSVAYADADGDGAVACEDCDDADAARSPAHIEVCDDSDLDEDCDGSADDLDDHPMGRTDWSRDRDADGYGDPDTAVVTACEQPSGYAADSTDCDDYDSATNPGGTEVCDALDADEDCDGLSDDDDPSVSAGSWSTWYRDLDGDDYGDASRSVSQCDVPLGYVADHRDCDDATAVDNSAAAEVCDGAGNDEDCDGLADDADPSITGTSDWYADADADGHGAGTATAACAAPVGHVAVADDCDDANPAVNPEATEVCDAADVDEDCDGSADDLDDDPVGRRNWSRDRDGDGYGDPDTAAVTACEQPGGYAAYATDCDDYDSATNPGGTEICDAFDADEDCDGLSDDDDPSVSAGTWSTWYRDLDGDDYGDASRFVSQCDVPVGFVADDRDCDDATASDNPAAAEVCDGAGNDEDCDGLADDADPSMTGTSDWYADADADGHGAGTATAACAAPPGHVGVADDCDDANPAVNPDATEVCDAANTDEDCDGAADDADPSATGERTWYADADADAYGTTVSTSACDQPTGYAAATGDCDDAASAVHPGATEVCDGADTDEDCDGRADDADTSATGLATWFGDDDADLYGDDADRLTGCDAPVGFVAANGDCDDADRSVNPGSTEVCEDGVDNDCDGTSNGCGPASASLSTSVVYVGESAGDFATYYSGLAGVGDVDGDGYDDFIVGAPYHNRYTGAAYLVTGGPTPASGSLGDADAIYTSATANAYAGWAVAGAGDVNADGYDDLLIGAPYETGVTYLLLGEEAPGDRALSAADAAFTGTDYQDWAGYDLAGAGDVNDDGYDDVLIGAHGNDDAANDAGAAYLVLGSSSSASLALSAADAVYLGVNGADFAGIRVAGVGDVDGDAFADILVGADGADDAGDSAGAAYLVLGSRTPGSASLASADATFWGEASGDDAGVDIAGAGDVDGDGYDDLLIGAYAATETVTWAGSVYLVRGGTSLASASLASADAEYEGEATIDLAGWSVDGAGDVDQDGFDDVLVGAVYSDAGGAQSGAAYLVLGSTTPSSLVLSASDAIYTGASAGDCAGNSVAGAGDVDGDGYSDLLIGSRGHDGGGADAGAVHLVLWSGW